MEAIMYLGTAEAYLTYTLKCEPHELNLLDFCYSPLVGEVLDIEDTIDYLQENNNLSLTTLLLQTYKQVRFAVCERALKILENETELIESFYKPEVKGILEQKDYLIAKITDEADVEPYSICIEFIQGDLSNTLDDNKTCKDNAILLIQYYMKERNKNELSFSYKDNDVEMYRINKSCLWNIEIFPANQIKESFNSNQYSGIINMDTKDFNIDMYPENLTANEIQELNSIISDKIKDITG